VRRILFLIVLAGAGSWCAGTNATEPSSTRVQVASGLSDQDLIVLSSQMDPRAVLLEDSAGLRPYIKAYLERVRPSSIEIVGQYSAALGAQWGIVDSPAVQHRTSPDHRVSDRYSVVVTPGKPRGLLLQAASLAGTLGARLILVPDDGKLPVEAEQSLAEAREVFAVGAAVSIVKPSHHGPLFQLADAQAVAERRLKELRKQGPVQTVVVTNPADETTGRMSVLAARVALEHRAALLLTDPSGKNAAELVEAATARAELRHVENVIWLGSPAAIPTERRPNPEAGKDKEIEMEPLTPEPPAPFSYATGRLYHPERGTVPLMLAQQRLLAGRARPRALVASNSGGSLPLLEAFSRNTAKELQNRGFQTTALFGDDISADTLRKLLLEQEVFVWEGHHMTMVKDYQMPTWTEPMSPSLVFLQSCLALNDAEAGLLLRRGAAAVVSSSSRTYSGTGGAFTLAYFDALLYENQTLGGSLRQGKNFLTLYALLKQKHLGLKAKQIGANFRSAWAFTLWGDPTAQLPRPEPPADALAAVSHELKGRTLTISLPAIGHERVASGNYEAAMLPNARLAGLMSRDEEENQRLVPLVFVEVQLRRPGEGAVPHLTSTLPDRRWVFGWDARRSTGYLLVVPREKDRGGTEKFHFDWEIDELRASLAGDSRIRKPR
jgi:hypothetical protein